MIQNSREYKVGRTLTVFYEIYEWKNGVFLSTLNNQDRYSTWNKEKNKEEKLTFEEKLKSLCDKYGQPVGISRKMINREIMRQ